MDSLEEQNNYLTKKIKDEENKKIKEKNNYKEYKLKFYQDKKIIESNIIEESKIFISKVIINDFYKPFTKKEKKDSFTESLESKLFEFSQDLINKSKNFNSEFKENLQKIITNFNVNQNNKNIDHINIIVIGDAGTGKSTFINQALLLPENKKAKEGIGVSVTKKSELYVSDSLKTIRMWDTQGLDRKTKQENILKEVQRLVNEGLKEGPDHFINVIFYCTTGQRFQAEDGEFIREIMKLYPMDNLPVIITQLQAYFEEEAKEMEVKIREILLEYLEEHIVEKIDIKNVVSKDKKEKKFEFKAYGIPELLRCAVNRMEKAFSSATFKNILQDIKELCRNYVEEKINFIENISKDEIEILDWSKSMFTDDLKKYFQNDNNAQKNISQSNIYNNAEKEYFTKNFVKILTSKFISIYNNINNTTYTFENKDEPATTFKEKFEKIYKNLNNLSDNYFNQYIYKEIKSKYVDELEKQQSIRSKEYNTIHDIIDRDEIEKNFKPKLFKFFENEFFKYFCCIIIKVFIGKLKEIIINKYEKDLKENEVMTKVLNQKAEYSLKTVTDRLREKLLKELDIYFPKKIEENEKEEEINNKNELKDNFKFNF